jgi:hypothetical protein
MLLSHVKMQNDQESRMQHDLCVGEKVTTPLGKGSPSGPELVEQALARLKVSGGSSPSLLDHPIETRHPQPEVFKSEHSRPSRTAIIR